MFYYSIRNFIFVERGQLHMSRISFAAKQNCVLRMSKQLLQANICSWCGGSRPIKRKKKCNWVESNWVRNHTRDNNKRLQNRTTAQPESDLFITSMIIDQIRRHKDLLTVSHKITISERRRIVNLWTKGIICIQILINRRKLFNVALKLR